MEFELRGWNLGLEARIGATWLGFELRGWNLGLEARFWPSRLELSMEAGF